MVANKNYTRSFKFGRSGGQWVINGETWFTNRIAAKVRWRQAILCLTTLAAALVGSYFCAAAISKMHC